MNRLNTVDEERPFAMCGFRTSDRVSQRLLEIIRFDRINIYKYIRDHRPQTEGTKSLLRSERSLFFYLPHRAHQYGLV
jgi:hypothetical protein